MRGCGPARCCRPGAAEHTERLRLRQRGRPRPGAGLRRECRCSRAPVEFAGPMRVSCGHRSPASGSSATDVRRLRAAGESPQAMSEATATLLPRGMHPPRRMRVGNSVWAEGWAGARHPSVETHRSAMSSRSCARGNEWRAVAVTEVLGGQPEYSGVRRRSSAPTRSVRRCSGCRQSERAARGPLPATHPTGAPGEHSGLTVRTKDL